MINALYIAGILSSNFVSLGTVIALVVGSVVVGLVALLGLGFGIRKLSTHITGNGFHHYRPGTEDEYPKRERDAFIEAVSIYNRSHP